MMIKWCDEYDKPASCARDHNRDEKWKVEHFSLWPMSTFIIKTTHGIHKIWQIHPRLRYQPNAPWFPTESAPGPALFTWQCCARLSITHSLLIYCTYWVACLSRAMFSLLELSLCQTNSFFPPKKPELMKTNINLTLWECWIEYSMLWQQDGGLLATWKTFSMEFNPLQSQ